MNYCQFRNDVIKRMANAEGGGLPTEYQQVEYLQSTGEQIIDTGVNATTTLLVTVDFSLANTFTYGNGSFIFGAYYNTGGNIGSIYSFAFPNSTTGRAPSGGGLGNMRIPNVSSGTHTIQYRFGSQVIDDTQCSSYVGIASAPRELYLFGRNTYNSSDGGDVWTATTGIIIYHAQLGTADNATEYRDLYPCYRKSDNVTGMYDLINSEFIPYTGTANFIVGQDV